MLQHQQPGRRAAPAACMLALLCAAAPGLAADGFVRDATTGCMVFKANPKRGDTVAWQGRCKGGYANGPGVARWRAKDGAWVTFEGHYAQGRLQGQGRMKASGGDHYDGEYKDGLRDGQGVYVAGNGERYEGGYRSNQRHGHGVLTAVGRRTEGEWRNGALIGGGSTSAFAASQVMAPVVSAIASPATASAAAEVPVHVVRQRELARHAAEVQARWIASTMVLLILAMPAGLAALAAQLRLRGAVRLSDAMAARFASGGGDKPRASLFPRIVAAPLAWCFRTVFAVTARIADPFVKAGVRLGTCLYIAGFAAAAVVWAAMAVVTAVGVAAVIVTLVLLGAAMYFVPVLLRKYGTRVPERARSLWPRQRESFFGPRYIEPTGASNDDTVVDTSWRKR